MCNSYILKMRLFAAVCLIAALACRALDVPNEMRFTSIGPVGSGDGQALNIVLDGLGSAASNGCSYVSLGFIDMLGVSLYPEKEGIWRFDYSEVAMHPFNPEKNYQLFDGPSTYRAVATTGPVFQAAAALPDFEIGDGQGYEFVDKVTYEESERVYGSVRRDGVFLYRDMFTPHWLVWTTNGTRWQSEWPWVNVPIATNSTAHTFERVPVRWEIATRAKAVAEADGFCLIPGLIGEIEDFYLAQTECVEDTAQDLIDWGAAQGLCAAGDWPALPGRGTNYPVTGWPLDAALALCNLATACHNASTGEALDAVYLTNGAAFYRPAGAADLAAVTRDGRARGYRLPTAAEYTHAASGDARTVYPWGRNASDEWYYATNGLPVSEYIMTDSRDLYAFYRKYHLATTNSVGNYTSRNGALHLSPGRVRPARDQYRAWSIPAVNTNGQPVVLVSGPITTVIYFGDEINDAAWGVGAARCHDMAGNVSEMTWPPVRRAWGAWRVCVRGGTPIGDASNARASAGITVRAETGYTTVGFRFARDRILE